MQTDKVMVNQVCHYITWHNANVLCAFLACCFIFPCTNIEMKDVCLVSATWWSSCQDDIEMHAVYVKYSVNTKNNVVFSCYLVRAVTKSSNSCLTEVHVCMNNLYSQICPNCHLPLTTSVLCSQSVLTLCKAFPAKTICLKRTLIFGTQGDRLWQIWLHCQHKEHCWV
jgi:hypothetical protein